MRLEVLVGMVASGKSTYARQRADQGCLVVCHDSIAPGLHTRYRYEGFLRDYYRGIEEYMAREGLREGCDVLIDRTHLTLESRTRWVRFHTEMSREFHRTHLVTGEKFPLVAVVFPFEAPEVHAFRRFRTDPRGRSLSEWLHVAHHHAEQWAQEPILDTEGFTEIHYPRPDPPGENP
jgi:hypothetical protein